MALPQLGCESETKDGVRTEDCNSGTERQEALVSEQVWRVWNLSQGQRPQGNKCLCAMTYSIFWVSGSQILCVQDAFRETDIFRHP